MLLMPHRQPSSDKASTERAADAKKKDPYQEIIELLESYEEGCAKATMFDILDECCATRAANDHNREKDHSQEDHKPDKQDKPDKHECCKSGGHQERSVKKKNEVTKIRRSELSSA